VNVFDLSLDSLTERLLAWGEPAFRARQVYSQLWRRGATYEEMSDVSPALRERLAAELPRSIQIVDERSADRGATRKALLRLGSQGHLVEAVIMGYPDRVTVCVSSQVGCGMGCGFCATGQMGMLGNLSAGEIAAQVVWARRESLRLPDSTPQRLSNVVFMGMGEPIGGCLLPRQQKPMGSPPRGRARSPLRRRTDKNPGSVAPSTTPASESVRGVLPRHRTRSGQPRSRQDSA
jgi:23S rRNA (adenine2503-C2)-methyltransferase